MFRQSNDGDYEYRQNIERGGGDYYPLNDNYFMNSTNINNDSGIEMMKDDDSTSLLHESPTSVPVIHNLDSFLTDVYNYFRGKGFLCIFLDNLFELFSSIFVVAFFSFLVSFINYDKVFVGNSTGSLGDVVDFQREVPLWLIVFLGIFSLYWISKLFSLLVSFKTNWEISNFYHNTLRISEQDLQTIEWREVVQRIVLVPRLCIVKGNMNALDIANRILRKENYIIGLINLKIFNLSLPFPFFSKFKFITKTLEWSISYSLFNYVFDQNGIIKKEFLDLNQRNRLSRGLSRRFITIGILGLFSSPFIFFFLLINFFFEYAEEIKNRPGSLFSREWSPLARWKFREFNELPHYFQNRLNLSYSHANQYVSSFPSEVLSIMAKFISFIVGSFLAVLIVFGIFNDEFLMNFQIFDRSPIWYIGIFGTVVAVTRSLITDENQVFQPAKHMARTVQNTHYLPKGWIGKTHTYKVRDEFLELFEYRIIDFLREISSVLFTPFILMFSLPKSSFAILEFLGNTTINMEGVGPICEFGAFSNVRKLGDNSYGSLSADNKISQTKQAKLEKSMINFKVFNPEWNTQDNELFKNMDKFAKEQQQKKYQHQQTQSNPDILMNSTTNNNEDGNDNDNDGGHHRRVVSSPNVLPQNSSTVDDFHYIQDSHYIPPEIVRAVLGNDNYHSGTINQNVVNAVNDLHQSFYESQIFGKNGHNSV